jgi:hypothetical protein
MMKDRYDGSPGKDAGMAKTRHNRLEAEHSAKDNFVKKQQAEVKKYMGKSPMLKGEAMEFNAYMCNNGENAQSFAKKITGGLDKVAFPVDGEGNDS